MGDRKYRHRGYMEDDRDEDRGRRRRRRHDPFVDGPRGRTAGPPGEAAFKCAVCGERIQVLGRVEPDATCPRCGKPLHTCTNCAHFDTSARFECRKPIAERIESKVKANRCELFSPSLVRDLTSRGPASPDDARAAFEALFRKL